MDKPIPEAVLDRACAAYAAIADDCMGLVRRKAMQAALTAAQQQGQAVAWADEWRAAVAAKLSSYGLSEEAAAVFASSELDEYKAGLCDCAENDPADMVDLMMGVALDATEKWKAESAGRPFGYKRTASPPSAPVGVETVDAAAWIEVLELPEGFRVAEHLPGIWEYQFDIEDEADEDSDRKVSGTSWNHPALAAIAAWSHAYDALAQQPAAVDRARFRKAPCYRCGYNGPGYFQPETHPCAALYHAPQHQEPKS